MALEAEYQAYRQNAPADGIGLHDSWEVYRKAKDQAFLAGLTPQQQADIKPRLAAGTEAWGQRAAEDEVATGKAYETGVLQKNIETYRNTITADPASFDQARDALFGKIDQSANLGTAGKEAMKGQAVRSLQQAYWLAHYGQGQPGGAEALGRGTAMTGSSSPGSAAADPRFSSLSEDDKDGLIETARRAQNQIHTDAQQVQFTARGTLVPRLQSVTASLMKTGQADGQLPTQDDFLQAYGDKEGPEQFNAFQHVRKLGLAIDGIMTLSPREQDARLQALAPRGHGPQFTRRQDDHAVLAEAIAANRKARSEDPNGYVAAAFPGIGRLWAQAGTSPESMRIAITTTGAAMAKLGIRPEEQQLLPKAMVSKAVATFNDTARPAAERVASLRSLVSATQDPAQQRAIFQQFVKAGFPPMLEYAAAAYTKGDTLRGDRFAQAALGNAATPGRPAAPGPLAAVAPAGADGTMPASPAAAANTPAGPAPLRSLAGPGIDLGAATQQALGSSLTGDAGATRADMLRTRMIANAMQLNGGDRAGAITQVDGDFASITAGGWVPSGAMQAPIAGGGMQLAEQTPTVGSNGQPVASDASPGGMAENKALPQTPEQVEQQKQGEDLIENMKKANPDNIYDAEEFRNKLIEWNVIPEVSEFKAPAPTPDLSPSDPNYVPPYPAKMRLRHHRGPTGLGRGK
ncbi:MAG: hypothetical protein ACREFM_20710, partial [Hypericibacter sp.]